MRTIFFNNSPKIICNYSSCGPKESCGFISDYVDRKYNDDMLGEKTFEKAETKMLFENIRGLINKSNKKDSEIDLIIAGDLLNQIIAATFSARNFEIGYFGAYNACATFTEALTLGAVLVDGGYLNNVICATSSHFSSAERQYRYPLELGCTRPPLSQWTVTGAGSSLISNKGKGIVIKSATIGRIVDFGVTDANNMGAAMAPSAADTLYNHFKNSNTCPEDYDMIFSGDLGTFGSRILKDLLWEKSFDIEKQHVDCGELVYRINEDEFQGGSGAGCSSMVFNSYIIKKLLNKEFRRVILMSTGALLSSLTTQQGESIPGIAHAVVLES